MYRGCMVRLKSLLESSGRQPPSPKLAPFILKHYVVEINDWLYHGTPYEGMKEMLTSGIYGTEHSIVAEYDAFSTSLNSEVIAMFSEGDGETGLQFKVQGAKVIVLDDILTYLVTQLPGSGMSAEIDDEEKFQKFVRAFRIPTDNWKKTPYLPYNYLSSLGVDAWMYDYVYKRWSRGMPSAVRDESEICFIGKGIEKLNGWISGIYVDGEEYEPDQKAEALRAVEERL